MIPYESHLTTSLRPDAVARKVLLVSAAVTLALYMIPFGQYLARPLLLLSTLAHELGHGLTALMLGGRFQRLEMWASGAGAAHLDLAGFGRLRQGLVLADGLVGPSGRFSSPYANDLTGTDNENKTKQIWDERSNRREAVWAGPDYDYSDIESAHSLLPLEASIHRDEDVEAA